MDVFYAELARIQMLVLTMGRQVLDSLVLNALIARLRRQQQRAKGPQRHSRYWLPAWCTPQERQQQDHYMRLMPSLELEDPLSYRNFVTMPAELFQELET